MPAPTTALAIATRIFEVQNRMLEIHETRDNLATIIMQSLGDGTIPGISVDNLISFADKIIPLNAEFGTLSAEHAELMSGD
jgi:hypothetical protein